MWAADGVEREQPLLVERSLFRGNGGCHAMGNELVITNFAFPDYDGLPSEFVQECWGFRYLKTPKKN